jgi:hypothetical protein
MAVSATSISKLPKLPSISLAGDSSQDVVLVPVTKGSGSRKLRSYTPHGKNLYIQFACEGKGKLTLTGYFTLSTCNAQQHGVFLDEYPRQAGHLASPRVIAPTNLKWEFFITSGP